MIALLVVSLFSVMGLYIGWQFKLLKLHCEKHIVGTLDENGLQLMVNKAHQKYNEDLISALNTELDSIKRVINSLEGAKFGVGMNDNPLLLSGKPQMNPKLKVFEGKDCLASAPPPSAFS